MVSEYTYKVRSIDYMVEGFEDVGDIASAMEKILQEEISKGFEYVESLIVPKVGGILIFRRLF